MNVLDKTLFNLHTISTIPVGKRISTAKEFITIDETNTGQWFWRWLAGDSRAKAIIAICREVHFTIAISQYIVESMDILKSLSGNEQVNGIYSARVKDLRKIHRDLSGAVQGVKNLCETYRGDADVLGHLSPLIDESTAHLDLIISTLIALGEHLIVAEKINN
jgi:hypothetical protein